MKFFADFHIHSKYSRATSREMDLEHLNKWAAIKGIKVLGTGDFTHPVWFKEIKKNLVPAEAGLFKFKFDGAKLKNDFNIQISKVETRFILTAEISCIYSKGGRTYRVHLLVFAPSFEAVEKINAQLNLRGNLKSDGRPILGLDAKELTKIIFNSCPDCAVIPAHAWTPWFSVFGSASGFNSLEACFEEYTKYIFAIETGLSSDPAMNWRWSKLDKISFISNSDSHSLTRLGREGNFFDTDLSYRAILGAVQKKDASKFLATVEFFPEEGKYHYDGHRACEVRLTPEETKKNNGKCPKCGKSVTVGVMARVSELADRPLGFKPIDAIPYYSTVPLDEIIADGLGLASTTGRAVKAEYKNLIEKAGDEINILLNLPIDNLASITLPEIAEGIKRMREGRVHIDPGYDGEYGKIKIFEPEERKKVSKQKSLF